MAVGRRFGSSVLLLVTLASLVGLISAWGLHTLTLKLEGIKRDMQYSGEWDKIKDKGAELYPLVRKDPTAHLFWRMVEHDDCEFHHDTYDMLLDLKGGEPDNPVFLLAKYASRIMLERCSKFYRKIIRSSLGRSLKSSGVLSLLIDDFILRFYNENPDFDKLIIDKGEGKLLSMMGGVFNHLGWTAQEIASNSEDCEKYVRESRETFEFIRTLIAITQDYQLRGHSNLKFQLNAFRFVICEEILEFKREGILERVLKGSY